MSFLYGILPGILVAFGMGGGSLLIFTLNMFTDYAQQEIQYINLWAFIFAAAYSVFSYGKKGKIDKKLLKIMLPFTVISCAITSIISQGIETEQLKKYFGIFLIVIGIWQVFQIIYKNIKKKKVKNIDKEG